MKLRHSVRALCAILASIWISADCADQTEVEAKFEVTSVKPSTGRAERPGIWPLAGGTLRAENETLWSLIRTAYRVYDYQIHGGPSWIKSDRFEIDAKAAGNPSLRQIEGSMLQALLKDRFRLKIHRETKKLPEFALVAAKGGLRLKATTCATIHDPTAPPPGPAGPTECSDIHIGPGVLGATGIRMEELVRALMDILGRPVIDRTGFTGAFDAHLEFTPEGTSLSGTPFAGDSGAGRSGRGAIPAPVDRPSIFSALQEELGLRLESTKGPVEIIVIDSVERPTAN